MSEQIKGWLTRDLGVVPNPSFVRARSTLSFGQKYPQKSWGFKGQIENWRGKPGKSKIGDYAAYMQSAYHHETSHLRFNSRDILLQDNYFSSPTVRKTRTSFALTGAVYAM